MKLINGDTITEMSKLPDQSIDLILADLPYVTTASKWDKNIDFNMLWLQYERIIKEQGAIVLFASGLFTNKLINSNDKIYRYKWIWKKSRRGNFVNANNRPMTSYEEICVFSKGITANTKDVNKKMKYNPQGIMPINKVVKHGDTQFGTMAGKRPGQKKQTVQKFTNYPYDILEFNSVAKPVHPTEKPVDLLEYLIKTYSDENETVLDNTMGSGSTGVACRNLNRDFIGIELDETYFKIAENRIREAQTLVI